MEILFWLEPSMDVIWGVSLIILLVAGVLSVVAFCAAHDDSIEGDKNDALIASKLAMRIAIVATIICIAVSPLTKPMEIYKRVLIHRGINSDTAENLIANVNKLLNAAGDKIIEKLEE